MSEKPQLELMDLLAIGAVFGHALGDKAFQEKTGLTKEKLLVTFGKLYQRGYDEGLPVVDTEKL